MIDIKTPNFKTIPCPKEYTTKKHPITGENVRVHGHGAFCWCYIGKRGTGYKGRGKQISKISVTPDKRYYNIETGIVTQL